jgi:hypothetical protein
MELKLEEWYCFLGFTYNAVFLSSDASSYSGCKIQLWSTPQQHVMNVLDLPWSSEALINIWRKLNIYVKLITATTQAYKGHYNKIGITQIDPWRLNNLHKWLNPYKFNSWSNNEITTCLTKRNLQHIHK